MFDLIRSPLGICYQSLKTRVVQVLFNELSCLHISNMWNVPENERVLASPISRNRAASADMNRLPISESIDWEGIFLENSLNGVSNIWICASGLLQVEHKTILGTLGDAMKMALYLNLFLHVNESSVYLDVQST